MRIIGVIPARYNSSRLPGKPLVDICGKPMIWWVYDRIKNAECFDEIVIATDDDRILNVCKKYGLPAIMTSKEHDTPTSRLYEVSTKIDSDLYLVIMGDEPLVDVRCFELIIPNNYSGGYYVGALQNTLTDAAEVIDFSNQKVVTNQKNEVMFISRSPIPYPKGSLDFKYKKVTGVQIFSKNALEFFSRTPRSVIEKAEENDLMRFVENSIPVVMTDSEYKTVSVDTPKDLDYVRSLIAKRIQNGEIKL